MIIQGALVMIWPVRFSREESLYSISYNCENESRLSCGSGLGDIEQEALSQLLMGLMISIRSREVVFELCAAGYNEC